MIEELKLVVRRLLVSTSAVLLLVFGLVAHGQSEEAGTFTVMANDKREPVLSWTLPEGVMADSYELWARPPGTDRNGQREVPGKTTVTFTHAELDGYLESDPQTKQIIFGIRAYQDGEVVYRNTVRAPSSTFTAHEVFTSTAGTVSLAEGPLNAAALADINALLEGVRGINRVGQITRSLTYKVVSTLDTDAVAWFSAATGSSVNLKSTGDDPRMLDFETASHKQVKVTIEATEEKEGATDTEEGATDTEEGATDHIYSLTINLLDVDEDPFYQGAIKSPVFRTYEPGVAIAPLPDILATRDFRDPEGKPLTVAVASMDDIRCDDKGTISEEHVPTLNRVVTGKLLVSHALVVAPGVEVGDYVCESDVKVKDPAGNESEAFILKVRIRVGPNTPPIFAGGAETASKTTDENTSIAYPGGIEVFDFNPSDNSNSQELGLSATTNVKGLTPQIGAKDGRWILDVVAASRVLNHEALPDGVLKYTITLSDKYGGTDTLAVTLTVKDKDDPLVEVKAPPITVQKGNSETVNLLKYVKDEDDPEKLSITGTCLSPDPTLLKVTDADATDAMLTVEALGVGDNNQGTLNCTAQSGEMTLPFEVTVLLKSEGNNAPYFNGGVVSVAYSFDEGAVGSKDANLGLPHLVTDNDTEDTLNATIIEEERIGVAKPKATGEEGEFKVQLYRKAKAVFDYEGGDDSFEFMLKVDDNWNGKDYLIVQVRTNDINDAPTLTGETVETVTLVENGSTEEPLSGLFSDVDANDKNRLRITADVDDDSVATVEVDALGLATITAHTLTEGETEASTTVTVTAIDSGNQSVETQFSIEVSKNTPPSVSNSIADVDVHMGQITDTIQLSGVFTDADGEVSVIGASSSDESVALAILVDDMAGLVVVGRAVGSADITVSAEDTSGAGVSDTFAVTVSDSDTEGAPKLAGRIGNVTVTADVNEVTDLTQIFVASDASDVLTYSALNSNPEVLAVSFDHNQGTMTLMGQGPGSADLTVIATDQNGASIADTAVVSIETMPKAQGALAAVALELGLGGTVVDFGHAFTDEDGDMLSYEVRDLDSNVVEWNLMGTQLSLMPANGGNTVGLIVASDPAGRTAVQRLSVSVSDEAVKDVASRVLAGFGQAVLNSSTDAISSRVVAERQSSDIGATLSSLARQLNSTQNSSYASPNQATSNSVLNQPMSFSMNFGEGVQSWSMWSQTDSQTVGGEGATSDVNSLHLGVDLQASERWLVGLAVAQHVGASDFSFGNIDATLENELTTVLPYASFRPNSRSQVWTMAGVGRGETVINEEDRNSLSMHIMAVGGRYELGRAGNINFAGRGDVAMATLETEQGTGISGGLSADLNRVRAGIESSMSFESDRGIVTPFLDVGLRRDGGTEFGHTGAEIAGGVKIETGTLTLEAKGRLMAANGYDEDGFSVKATMNPSANGTGLSLSVEPRWGNADMRNTFWSAQQQVNSLALNTGNSVRSEIGYGFLVDSDQMLVAPFARVDHSAESRTQTLFGARVNRSLDSGSMQFEAGVGSLENHSQGTVEAIAGVTARLQF